MLLLNNDIKVERDFIAPLWERLKAQPSAFCVSPLHLDFDGNYNGGMNRFGFRFSLPWSGPFYRGSREEAKTAGETLFTANGLFSREKYLAVGGFDDLYHPISWEDTDICTRAWRRGWPSLYEPSSVIYHKSSATVAWAGERAIVSYRNAFLWFFSNFSSPGLRLKVVCLLPLTLVLCVLTGRWAQVRGFWRSFSRLGRALRRRAKDKAQDVLGEKEIFRKFYGRR